MSDKSEIQGQQNPIPHPLRGSANGNIGVGQVVGFAILVQQEDGTRMIVWSDDVRQAEMTISTPHPTILESDDGDRIVSQPTLTYNVHLSGQHANFRMNIQPMQEILELGERKQLAADD